MSKKSKKANKNLTVTFKSKKVEKLEEKAKKLAKVAEKREKKAKKLEASCCGGECQSQQEPQVPPRKTGMGPDLPPVHSSRLMITNAHGVPITLVGPGTVVALDHPYATRGIVLSNPIDVPLKWAEPLGHDGVTEDKLEQQCQRALNARFHVLPFVDESDCDKDDPYVGWGCRYSIPFSDISGIYGTLTGAVNKGRSQTLPYYLPARAVPHVKPV